MRIVHRVLLPTILMLASTATLAMAGGGLRADLEGPAKDGTYAVHTFMCGKDVPFEVSAWAEGVVKGHRRTVPLKLRQLGNSAIYQFDRAWPAEGQWLIRLASAKPNPSAATTVVAILPDGQLGEAKVVWGADGRHECDVRLATAVR
jgi:hypothetical protein